MCVTKLKLTGKQWIALALVVIFTIGSLLVADKVDNWINKDHIFEVIEDKQNTAADVTAICAAASVVIGAIPDDSTTPVAQQISDAGDYMLIATVSLTLEKIIMNVASFITFKCLYIAFGFLMFVFVLSGYRWHALSRIAVICLTMGVCLYFAVPVTTVLSEKIDETINFKERIEELRYKKDKSAEEENEEIDDDRNWFERAYDNVVETVESIADSVSNVKDYAKGLYLLLIEVIVGFILTTVILPIGVVLFLKWIVNVSIGFLPMRMAVNGPKSIPTIRHYKLIKK